MGGVLWLYCCQQVDSFINQHILFFLQHGDAADRNIYLNEGEGDFETLLHGACHNGGGGF